MKFIDVLIFYEHKTRDLDTVVAIQSLLSKWGKSVAICHSSEVNIAIIKYIPKIILVPFYYTDNDSFFAEYFEQLYSYKPIIINPHHEQIGSSCSNDRLIPQGKAKECYHFAWGRYFYELLRTTGIIEEQIFIVGSPRLDFFLQSFASLNIPKSILSRDYLIDKNKKWLLFASNLTIVDESWARKLVTLGYKDYSEYRCIIKESKQKIFKWLLQLSNEMHNEIEIIYRPHPSELLEYIPKNIKNFHFIKDLPIRNWILASDLVLGWNSTSLIEAYIAGKQTFVLRPFEIPNKFSIELIDNFPKVDNYNKLKSIINLSLEEFRKMFNYSEMNLQLDYIYGPIDGRAVERISNRILSILSKSNNFSPKVNIETLSIFFRKFLILTIKSFLFILLTKIGILKYFKKYKKTALLTNQELTNKYYIRKLKLKFDYIYSKYSIAKNKK